jgi:hypothetical protein
MRRRFLNLNTPEDVERVRVEDRSAEPP